MSNNKQMSFSKNIKIQLQFLFRKYPIIPYQIKWSFISCILSLIIGSISAFFLFSLEWATNFREENLWLLLLLPIGGLLIGLLYHYYGSSITKGNNLLIENIHDPKEILPIKMAPFVYIGTIVTHLLGGSAGREGTALQMAASLADQFSKPFKLDKEDRRMLLIAAIGGGFGAVFGTPIAGAIFAIEFSIIGKVRYNALFPTFLTAILSNIVTTFWNANHTHYHIQFIPEVTFFNVFYAIVAGIIFGACAAIFSKSIHKTGQLFKKYISFPPLQPFIGGLIVFFLVWIIGSTKYIGLGIPTILQSFDEQLPIYSFALKLLLTIITLASGFKGGEVTPLFFIGATLGSAISLVLPLPTSLLAGMGFVAVFSGATNTPIACIIMAIELFGVECGVFVAIACIVSYLVSGHTSIYSSQIIGESKIKRYSYTKGKSLNDL